MNKKKILMRYQNIYSDQNKNKLIITQHFNIASLYLLASELASSVMKYSLNNTLVSQFLILFFSYSFNK